MRNKSLDLYIEECPNTGFKSRIMDDSQKPLAELNNFKDREAREGGTGANVDVPEFKLRFYFDLILPQPEGSFIPSMYCFLQCPQQTVDT